MLLLIHQCQHDIKVGQGGEIIQAGWRLRPKFVQPFTNSAYLHLPFAHCVCAKGELCVCGTSRTSNGLKSGPCFWAVSLIPIFICELYQRRKTASSVR